MMIRKFLGTALLVSLTWSPVGIGEDNQAPTQQPPKAKPYGDWALQCPQDTSCSLRQRVFLDGDEKRPLLSIILQYVNKPTRLLIAIRTPLNTVLISGLELSVDKGTADTYPFHHCRSEGCLTIFPVKKGLRKSLRLGNRANVGYVLTDGKKYNVPVSLKGITAGLKALKKAAASTKK